jgi:transcription elongation factor Elf1
MSNVEKIQKMVKGIYNRPIQTGYQGKTDNQRKEGEEWTDARGRSWKIEDGKRKQITKVPPRGFDKCKDCEKLILKTIDQQTYDRFQKCKYCQMEFEANLHQEGKWNDWVKEQEEKRWEAVLAEYETEMEEIKKADEAFDKTVANAIANNEHRK